MASLTVALQATAAGHETYVLVLLTSFDNEDAELSDTRLQRLRDAGVVVATLPIPAPRTGTVRGGRLNLLRSLLAPNPADDYPSIQLAPEIRAWVRSIDADALWVVNYGPVAALARNRSVPAFAVLGDPLHLVSKYWLKRISPRPTKQYATEMLTWLGRARTLPPWIEKTMRPYEACGWYGAQHAAWLTARGVFCEYVRVPVVDLAGPDWQQRRVAAASERIRVALVGGVEGTASRQGHSALATAVLPALDRQLGADGYELHFIGRTPDVLPAELQAIADHPSVHFRGHVTDLESELFATDVLLFPSRYPVGIRTRIVTALGFGCCVVSNDTAALGAPELIDGVNCLLATDEEALARQLVAACVSPELRERLGTAGRRTYEESFSPWSAGRRVVEVLENLAAVEH
jgi:glycosyltransferase involved in cell wall biosynthesis